MRKDTRWSLLIMVLGATAFFFAAWIGLDKVEDAKHSGALDAWLEGNEFVDPSSPRVRSILNSLNRSSDRSALQSDALAATPTTLGDYRVWFDTDDLCALATHFETQEQIALATQALTERPSPGVVLENLRLVQELLSDGPLAEQNTRALSLANPAVRFFTALRLAGMLEYLPGEEDKSFDLIRAEDMLTSLSVEHPDNGAYHWYLALVRWNRTKDADDKFLENSLKSLFLTRMYDDHLNTIVATIEQQGEESPGRFLAAQVITSILPTPAYGDALRLIKDYISRSPPQEVQVALDWARAINLHISQQRKTEKLMISGLQLPELVTVNIFNFASEKLGTAEKIKYERVTTKLDSAPPYLESAIESLDPKGTCNRELFDAVFARVTAKSVR